MIVPILDSGVPGQSWMRISPTRQRGYIARTRHLLRLARLVVCCSVLVVLVASTGQTEDFPDRHPVPSNTTANVKAARATEEAWSHLNPFYQGTFYFVGRTSDGFIAGSRSGYMMSDDGWRWSSFSNVDGLTMDSADTDGETTVAVIGTRLYWKTDDQEWKQVPDVLGAQEVRWLNGRFIAVGTNGRVFLSDTGQQWTTIQTQVSYTLEHVAWNGTYYVAEYEISYTQPRFLFSVTGSIWSSQVNIYGGDCRFHDLDAGNGRFVGVGRNCTVYANSPSTWYVLDGHPELTSVTWTGGDFLAVGLDGGVYRSSNGNSWSEAEKVTANHLSSVIAGNDGLVAVGEYGAVLRSSDADDWTPVHAIEGELKGVAYNGQKFCAAGSDGGANYDPVAYESTNGIAWQKVDLEISGEDYPFGPRDMVWWDGRFWGLGGDNFLYSTDCRSWYAQNASAVSPGLERIVATSDFLIGAGNQKVFRRTRYSGWSQVLLVPGGTILDVGASNSTVVVSSSSGSVYTSIDGLSWFPIQIGASLDRITVFQNTFFANDGSRIWMSEDGFFWEQVADSQVCHSIFSGRGLLRCFGVYGFYESLDGTDWIETSSDFLPGWLTVAYNVAESPEMLVAVMIDGNMAALPIGQKVFEDDFESGDTMAWSTAVP